MKVVIDDIVNISLIRHVKLFVNSYMDDHDFKGVFLEDSKFTKLQMYVVFFYLCAVNRMYGYKPKGVYEDGCLVGLINYQNEKELNGCTISDVRVAKIATFTYKYLVDSRIRFRLEKYSEAANEIQKDLKTYDLCQVGLLKNAQGKGYLKLLINSLVENASLDDNVDHICVATFSEAKSKMYESIGFVLHQHSVNHDINSWVLVRRV